MSLQAIQWCEHTYIYKYLLKRKFSKTDTHVFGLTRVHKLRIPPSARLLHKYQDTSRLASLTQTRTPSDVPRFCTSIQRVQTRIASTQTYKLHTHYDSRVSLRGGDGHIAVRYTGVKYPLSCFVLHVRKFVRYYTLNNIAVEGLHWNESICFYISRIFVITWFSLSCIIKFKSLY